MFRKYWQRLIPACLGVCLFAPAIFILLNQQNIQQMEADSNVDQAYVRTNQGHFFKSHDQYILMYNRIPKTGSSSMLWMLHAIKEINNFHGPYTIYKQNIESLLRHINASEQMKYAKLLQNQKTKYYPTSIIVNNHVHFIDFTKFGALKQPIYFNVVRDPFNRFRSRFYWHRTAKVQNGTQSSNEWFRNYHLIEPDADPRRRDFW